MNSSEKLSLADLARTESKRERSNMSSEMNTDFAAKAMCLKTKRDRGSGGNHHLPEFKNEKNATMRELRVRENVVL